MSQLKINHKDMNTYEPSEYIDRSEHRARLFVCGYLCFLIGMLFYKLSVH